MNITRKIFIGLLMVMAMLFVFPLQQSQATSELIPLPRVSGGNVRYRGTTIDVLVPTQPKNSTTEFRGVWITPLTGDIARFTSEAQYKAQMLEVFQVMEYYNMNALLYHVRIMNDALYQSDLNRWSTYYHSNPSWDALPWIIEECHKRGIEFHAWMNPYRVTNSYSGTVQQYAATQPSYNVASDAQNLLKNNENRIILNPGEPAVRQFLIDTCLELMDRYNVDAIHFDDYFYISNVDDAHTRNKYNPDNLNFEDWRRLQVDTFIHDLSLAIRTFNQENNRYVQLGISPSGIYRNGNGIVEYNPVTGDAITNGSNTSGFAHYGNYLYSDTKLWIDQEWIDYIIPQSYWGFEHPTAGFADVMEWWVKIVKNKNVKLYSGMGLYMAVSGSNTYSWQTNDNEAYNQLLFLSQFDKNDGFCIFSYKHILYAYNGSNTKLRNLMEPVRTHFWNSPALLPTLDLYDPVRLGAVTGLRIENTPTTNTLQWNGVSGAKYYAIYRSNDLITYDGNEIIAIIGAEDNQQLSFVDTGISENYVYGIKPVSMTNTLGQGTMITHDGIVDFYNVTFLGNDGNVLRTQRIPVGTDATAPTPPTVAGYHFTGWNIDFTNVQEDIVVQAMYSINQYTVTFQDAYNNVLNIQQVNHGQGAIAPTPPIIDGFTFSGWSRLFANVQGNLVVQAVYDIATYTVTFKDYLGNVVLEETVLHGASIVPPVPLEREGYTFQRWNQLLLFITSDLVVEPIYRENTVTYTVVFVDVDDNVISTQEVLSGKSAVAPIAPVVSGFTFQGWNQSFTNITSNVTIQPIYVAIPDTVEVTFFDKEGEIIETQMVEVGENAIAPVAPHVVGFTFTGWSHSLENMLTPISITAEYTQNEYTVTFMNWNGEVFYTTTVLHGETASIDELPEREGYTFKEWTSSLEEITSTLTVFPIFERIPRETPPPVTSCSAFNFWQGLSIAGLFGLVVFFRRRK